MTILTIPIAFQSSKDTLNSFTSPEKVLSAIGSQNRFLLFIWVAMASLWGIGALPVMVSAFLMDDFCKGRDDENNNGTEIGAAGSNNKCTPQNGTVTEEFHLDGANSFLVDLTTSAYIAGMAMGSIFVPLIADRNGRRPALLLSLFLSGIVGIGSAFSPNIFVFIGMRFLQGLAFSGCILVNWVLAYECIPRSLRSKTALLFGLFWVAGYCLVAPLAYFPASWRQLIAAASAPSLLFAVIYFFTVPESLHFLASKRRYDALRGWIRKANRCAEHSGTRKIGQNELNNFLEQLEANRANEEVAEKSVPSVVHAKVPWHRGLEWTMVLYLAVSVYIWTCDTFVYYGLSFFSTRLNGDRYWNFTLVALVEIPSYVFAPTLLDRMGRRLFTAFMHFLAASAFFVSLFISAGEQPMAFLLLWLLAKFAISSAFTGLFVYSSELFPTIHRNICIGICSTTSQAIGIFAPTVRLMANISPMAPMLFFGSTSLLACLLTFILPETKGLELPEKTIAHVRRR